MGASPVTSGTDEEVEKLKWAERWGADTVMDLSTGGDLDACREAIIRNSTVPIGTVPIYSMIIGRKIEDLDERLVLETLEHQAKQGVDYFTIHAGVLREHLPFVRKRLIGIVSPRREPARQVDAPPQQAEPDVHAVRRHLRHHARVRRHVLARRRPPPRRPRRRDRRGAARASSRPSASSPNAPGAKGVQVMVEGPGHVPFDQIEYNMKLQRHALPRRAVLRARPARDRHLPRLRPHHELHRRHGRRLPRREHALLRHAEGAPRPAEEGRREAGLRRLQDRGPRRRRRPGHPRLAATATTS